MDSELELVLEKSYLTGKTKKKIEDFFLNSDDRNQFTSAELATKFGCNQGHVLGVRARVKNKNGRLGIKTDGEILFLRKQEQRHQQWDTNFEKRTKIEAFKGFDGNLCCRKKQYTIGEIAYEPYAKLCSAGIHFCTNPLDVFNYYPPHISRFCRIEVPTTAVAKLSSNTYQEDTKLASKAIRPTKELTSVEIAVAIKDYYAKNPGWEMKEDQAYYQPHITSASPAYKYLATDRRIQGVASDHPSTIVAGRHNASVVIGRGSNNVAATFEPKSVAEVIAHSSVAMTHGNCSIARGDKTETIALACGDRSIAVIGENCENSLAVATNVSSVADSCGSRQIAIVTGHGSLAKAANGSVAMAFAERASAQGKVGSYLILAEFGSPNGIGSAELINLQSFFVDGEIIKEDTAYRLVDGQIKESH